MSRKESSTISATKITAAATKYGAKIALICAVIAAAAVIITSMGGHNSNNTSINNNQIGINQINGGSIYFYTNYIKHSNETKLELQMGGVLDQYNMSHFAIVSSGDGRYLVDRLYIKLHGYERCGLRNETTTYAAPMAIIPYSIYVSPEYSEYDIIPIDHPGNIGSWICEGNSFDDFFVNFYFEPYTLFIISVELEARDLDDNKRINISSPFYKLIWVEHGNDGGCLNLSHWYDPRDLAKPKEARYIDKLTTLQYQLLTMNMDKYNYYDYLNKLDQRQLIAIMPQLKEISSKRADNIVFRRNIQHISDYLNLTPAARNTSMRSLYPGL